MTPAEQIHHLHLECDRLTDMLAAANDRFERVARWGRSQGIGYGSDVSGILAEVDAVSHGLVAAVALFDDVPAREMLGKLATLIAILALQLDTDLGACMDAAWEEIKDRKGRMVDGVFVKEGD